MINRRPQNKHDIIEKELTLTVRRKSLINKGQQRSLSVMKVEAQLGAVLIKFVTKSTLSYQSFPTVRVALIG